MEEDKKTTEQKENEAPMSENPVEEITPTADMDGGETASKTLSEKKFKRNTRIMAALLAIIFLAIGFLAGWAIGANTLDGRARDLAWLVEIVEDNYYKEVDDDALYDALFSALELDKFCSYYNEDEYKKLKMESVGQNIGYGISLLADEDVPRVFRTIYNSPVEIAGLESGMYIYRFGASEEELASGTTDELFDFLTENTSCTMEFGYSEEDKRIASVTAADYSAAYCEYRDSEKTFRFRGEGRNLTLTETEGGGLSVLDDKTAYIRLMQFEGNAAREFVGCLEEMKERGRSDLILDLRCNGGGYLTILCSIASHLLRDADEKKPVVATAHYRNGKTETYRANVNDFSSYFPADAHIRILADENTASASESLIGAMIDYGTVTMDDIYLRESTLDGEKVGKTYGKGVMQNTFSTPDGRALRLTVAEIRWPHGNSIHDVGVRADAAHTIQADLLASAESFLSLLNG